MSFAYLPWYTGDYRRDTPHLSMMEHGAYRQMLDFCWDQRGPLPLDERRIFAICNARSAEEMGAVRNVLAEFFVKMDDGHYNKRIQQEIERCSAISGKRAGAARERWKARDSLKEIADHHADSSGQDYSRPRSARMAQARAKARHSDAEWSAMVAAHGGRCVKCGTGDFDPVKDHILPIYQGGDDGIENIQPLCAKCNAAKGSEVTDYRIAAWRDAIAGILQASVHANGPSPSPSPSPSLRPEPEDKKTTRASRTSPSIPDVDPQVYRDWVSMRKQKRAAVTETAIAGIRREAAKAGISMQDALAMSCARGWTGFKAEWCAETVGGRGVNRQEAIESRNQAAADEWLRQEGAK